MSWYHDKKEITKEDYEAILTQEKSMRSFFTETQIMGYGATPEDAIEKDGKYYILYGISDTCD